jgi:hypothetical protein|tara:strand:- start:261 stop:476 length:216 start_codon:yes stop_codon:yes gene_type:complete
LLFAIAIVTFGSFLFLTGLTVFCFLAAAAAAAADFFVSANLLLPTFGVSALILAPVDFLTGEASTDGTILF